MKIRWSGLRRPSAPAWAVALVPSRGAERVLAWDEAADGTVVLAGSHHLYAVRPPVPGAASEGDAVLVTDRPWHLVDAASWDRDASTLHLTWVDRSPAVTWAFTDPSDLLQVVRERIQASVVLVEQVPFPQGRSARVVVRKNLADSTLLSQAVLGTGLRSSDPGVAETLAAATRRVREQVGLS